MIIGSLAMVLLAAYICYIVHAVVVYSMAVKTMGGLSPLQFFKGMLPAIMFAFSSASSVGTLPINLECVEELGSEAGMVMLAMVLTSVGLPVDGIALVAGVDRIFDMGRTTVNITGDAVCTTVVASMNKAVDRDIYYGRK